MVKGRLKNILFQIHLWLGLIAALPILLLCLTGAILSFRPQIEDLANHSIARIENTGEERDMNAVMETYSQNYNLKAGRITIPSNANEAVRIYASNRETGERVDAYFNPYTGELIADRNQSLSGFFTFNLRLHRGMIVGDTGRDIVLYSTIVLFLLLISGFILWLPAKIRTVSKSLRINFKARLKTLLYQWHTVLGVFAFIVLLAITFSGIYIGDRSIREGINNILFNPQVTVSNPANNNSSVENPDIEDTEEEKAFNLNVALDLVENQIPGNSETIVSFGRSEEDPIRIYKYTGGLVRLRETASFNFDGSFIGIERMSEKPLSANFRYINRFLHTGELLGATGQFIFLLACLSGGILTVTGSWMFMVRKRKKNGKKVNDTMTADNKSEIKLEEEITIIS